MPALFLYFLQIKTLRMAVTVITNIIEIEVKYVQVFGEISFWGKALL